MRRIAFDLRLALRALRRAPTFALATTLVLALGIGMAAAMVSVTDAVLRRPLPVHDETRIVLPRTRDAQGTELALWTDEVEMLDRESRTMRGVAGVVHWGAPETPMFDGARALVLHRAVVTGNFFDVLGTRPAVGRLVRPSDDVKGAPNVMVLSNAAWRRDFGADPRIVGRQITEPYTRARYTVLGVAPAGLDYPANVDYWTPSKPAFGRQLITVVARLAPRASPADARAELMSFTQRLDVTRQQAFHPVSADVRTLPQAILGDVRPMLFALTAAVALLLLVACVNVGTLLLLRGAARSRELVIRRAIGARASDVVRLLLAESGVLSLLGGALGCGVAMALVRGLVIGAGSRIPRADVIALDGAPLAIAASITLVAALVFGVLPAIVAARVDLASPLRGDARGGTESRRRHAIRRTLVVSQVALAVVVLAAAGLVARSLRRLETQPYGYAREHLAFISLAMPVERYASDTQRVVLGEQIVARVRALPGIVNATTIAVPAFIGSDAFITQVSTPGMPAASGRDAFVPFDMVGPDYFATMRIPIARGRAFTTADRAGAGPVVVISESVASRLWANADPIGRTISLGGEPHTVVGVARDTHFRSARDAGPMIYYPTAQGLFWQGGLAVRTSGELDAVLPSLRRALADVDPQLGVWRAQTMDDLIAEPLAQPRIGTVVLSAFGVAALLLAAIGLYGVLASAVRERTREIGVRLTLGATPARMRRDILSDALRVCGLGAALGLVGAVAASRVLTSLLFQTRPTDPIALSGACMALLVVAGIAAYVPARRATRVDPAVTLRAE